MKYISALTGVLLIAAACCFGNGGPKQYKLQWTYPPEDMFDGLVFEVWHCTNQVYKVPVSVPNISDPNWSLKDTTTNLFYLFDADKPAEFFAVRARDTITGSVSDWASN